MFVASDVHVVTLCANVNVTRVHVHLSLVNYSLPLMHCCSFLIQVTTTTISY